MKPPPQHRPKRGLFIGLFIPGILVAATGVGAGDLITAGLAGSEIGLALLWAAAVGSLLKWTLNEGLARWQMATGTTLLEGWSGHLGGWVRWLFLIYFLIWSYSVGGALFLPFLAITLLILNNRIQLVGRSFRNTPVINFLLIMTLAFFSFVGVREIWMLLVR